MHGNEESDPVTPLTPSRFRAIAKSTKLADVCYDIRGPVLQEANRLEEEGHRVIKLNIGNPAPFGFEAPEEIVIDVIHHLRESQGYCDSKGLYSARKAIMQEMQRLRVPHVEIDDIYIGNGVSELIVMAMQGLLNNGDEILVPAPDYPLWTAAITLSGGKAVHYRCDEQADWFPDLADMKRKISARTRGIVVINPNNPTGAVYSKEVLEDIVELALDDVIPQIGPGVGDQAHLVSWAQRADEGQQIPIDDVAGEEFLADGFSFRCRAAQPASDGRPVFISGDGTDGCLVTGLARKDYFIKVFVSHVQALRKTFAGRLIFGAEDNAAKVEVYGPNGHARLRVLLFLL